MNGENEKRNKSSSEDISPSGEIRKAVILARGLGKRMRSADTSAYLAADQIRAADAGMKAMIPVGRPFLDFVLSALADAGFTQVFLVVGPEHTTIREYYARVSPHRIEIRFAIQEKPLGTANALLAVEHFTADDDFLVLNSDNYYPVEVFRALRMLGEPGLPAFERESLVRDSEIPRERVLHYALLQISAAGYLEKIVEKPDEIPHRTSDGEVFISMNCWRFSRSIFRACRLVPRSARGEYELPEAVQFGLTSLGLRFKTIPFHAGVLDLSHRSDIAQIARRLADTPVDL
ncbi:MAG TPA: nucleotidyltransferase family protein [Candidatus Acidoferrales bacterium]|nr:nucleotidyltransferase family protein [Candidatus Acidoferrales bacterium]